MQAAIEWVYKLAIVFFWTAESNETDDWPLTTKWVVQVAV